MDICLGHITGCCDQCVPNEKNKECPHYHPVSVIVFDVKAATEDTDGAVTPSQDGKEGIQ